MARHADSPAAPDPELQAPAHATAWASLVYIVSALLLSYPALAGRFLLNPVSDQYKAGYAFREFAAAHLRSGQGFPQWNPFIEGGLPYVAAMHGDIFYPTFILRMIMPTDMAMTWEFPIHLVLCGLFTFLFLRAWNFSFHAALIGGLAYMLGGSIAGYASAGHDGKLFVSTMLPLTLLLLTRGVRDGRRWAWGALAIAIGLAVLSPHPQLLQYLLLTSGAFALYVAFTTRRQSPPLPRNTMPGRLTFAAGAVGLGLLIGAVQYWPAIFEYKAWSPRAAGHDFATASSYSFPIEETLNAYWPQFSGILSAYWGRNGIHFHSDYFGVVALMLVGAAFGRSATPRTGFRRFWLATALVALVWAFGGYTPFFSLILAVVPGTKYFRAPSTIIYVTAFAVAVLAALGAERVLERRVTTRYALGWIVASAVFALLMSVGGYTALSSATIASMKGSLPPQYIDMFSERAAANAGSAILGAWRSFVFVAAAAGVVWAYLTNRVAPRVAAGALAAVLVVDLWSVERMYWTFSAPARQLFASDPAVDAIKADIAKTGQPGRVWTEERLGGDIVRDPNFVGDGLMLHGLRLVGVYHGNELGTYQQLVGGEYRESQTILTPQFWRHENVQYLYTGGNDSAVAALSAQLHLATPPLRLAGPVRDAAGSMVFAYKLPMNNPAAWVASAMVKAPEDQALATISDPRFDAARVAILDTSATHIPVAQFTTLPEPAANAATVTATAPGSYDVSLQQPAMAGQALVVSENYFPGWHATADGKDAPVGRANYNLIGIALPAGARSIQLRFTDAAYEKGKVVTLVAVLLACVLWVLGFVAERSRRSSARLSV